MKVSKDGSKLEVVAWGFRAPGGVGVRSDGVVTTGENEGTFVPACKITWTPPGKVTFNGVVPSKWDHSNYVGPLPGAPTDYEKPLCWIPYYADNSSGSQVWVPQNTSWDPRHAGELLHLSYGKSSVFRVLREEVNGVVQGGVYRLPIDVSAAVMRARFHSHNGQLYAVGFRGWQTNGRDALHRVRYTGVNTALPVELHAHQNGLLIRFSAPLDAATAEDPSRYSISKWNYVWGPQYGSGRFSIDQRDLEAEQKAITEPSKGAHNIIDTVTVAAAKVVDDGRGVFLYIPKMTPAMQMEVKLDLADAKGGVVRETIYNTVHTFAPEFQIPGVRWQDIRVAETKPVGEPGLVMTFNGETTDAVRVDQLALTVPEGMAPSVFIAPRAFGAAWQGTLVVPERDDYTFALEGRGTVSLRIDGKVVVSGELPVAASAPLSLAKGSHAIYCSYQSPANGEARVRLLWSSPQFRSEPVPASAFRFIPSAELESWSKVRTGREVFVAAQCVKCHAPRNGVPRDATPELLTAAPDFKNIGNRLDAGWLEQWVRAPQGHCPTIAANDAASVAGYLATLKDTDAEGGAPPPSGPGFQRDSQIKRAASPATQAGSESQPHLAEPGAALVEKLHLGFWIEPLTKLRKFSDHGLVEFLQHPALHHADTTFPDVRLSRDEALQVAAYVASRQPAPGARGGSPGDMAAGAKIVASSCSACHATADAKPSTAVAASFEDVMRRDWTVKGCVAENRGRAPDLHLSRDDVSALIAFRNSDRDVGLQSLRRFAPAEYATSQMKLLNCAQCHAGAAGDGSKIPDITFAGEKFDRDWLTGLFSGRHPKIRGWLDARMPAFASRAANLSLGLAAKHGVPLQTPAPAARPELVAVGAKLAGSEGYACVACHDAGTKKALQVFEGQGTNLQLAGERLRYDYFQRWMHFPQRIAPTTIMPRFTQGRDRGLLNTPLDGDAEKQFEAVWQWMQTLRNGGL
jgi:mono/diheme cytochrome c family protein